MSPIDEWFVAKIGNSFSRQASIIIVYLLRLNLSRHSRGCRRYGVDGAHTVTL